MGSNTLTVLLLLSFWVACGALVYGQVLADLQRSFPFFAWRHRARNCVTAAAGAILGPFGLFMCLLTVDRKNWGYFHYRTLSKEASWQAFQEEFPGLDEKHFLNGAK